MNLLNLARSFALFALLGVPLASANRIFFPGATNRDNDSPEVFGREDAGGRGRGRGQDQGGGVGFGLGTKEVRIEDEEIGNANSGEDDFFGRAAAPVSRDDCECQCNSYTFLIGRRVYGNCNSPYEEGLWCYVDKSKRQNCKDVRSSTRFRDFYWSYQACATPTRRDCYDQIKGDDDLDLTIFLRFGPTGDDDDDGREEPKRAEVEPKAILLSQEEEDDAVVFGQNGP